MSSLWETGELKYPSKYNKSATGAQTGNQPGRAEIGQSGKSMIATLEDWVLPASVERPLVHGSHLALVVNDTHVLTVSERPGKPDNLPGGASKPGETPVEALLREMDEELGVRLSFEPVPVISRDSDGTADYVATIYVVHCDRLPILRLPVGVTAYLRPLALPDAFGSVTIRHLRALASAGRLFANSDRFANAVNGYVRDLTREGVEPNPGPAVITAVGNIVRGVHGTPTRVVDGRVTDRQLLCCGLCRSCKKDRCTTSDPAVVNRTTGILVRCKGGSHLTREGGQLHYDRKPEYLWLAKPGLLIIVVGNRATSRLDSALERNLAREWVRDLTREGVEANPGPAFVELGSATQRAGYTKTAVGPSALASCKKRAYNKLGVLERPIVLEVVDAVSGLAKMDGYYAYVVDALDWLRELTGPMMTMTGTYAPAKFDDEDTVDSKSEVLQEPAAKSAPSGATSSKPQERKRKRAPKDDDVFASAQRFNTVVTQIVTRLKAAPDPTLAFHEWVFCSQQSDDVRMAVSKAMTGALAAPMERWNSAIRAPSLFRVALGMLSLDSSSPVWLKVASLYSVHNTYGYEVPEDLEGWIRDLTLEGIEPNPGPTLNPTVGDVADVVKKVVSGSGTERTDPLVTLASHTPLAALSKPADVALDVVELAKAPSASGIARLAEDVVSLTPLGAGISKVREALPVNNEATGAPLDVPDVPDVPAPEAHPGSSGLHGVEWERPSVPVDKLDRLLTWAVANKNLVSDAPTRALAEAMRFLGFENTGPGLTGGETNFAGATPGYLRSLLLKTPSNRVEEVTRQHDLDYLAARSNSDLDRADERAITELSRLGPTARAAARALQVNMAKRALLGTDPNTQMGQDAIGMLGAGASKGDGPRITKEVVDRIVEAARATAIGSPSTQGLWKARLAPVGKLQVINSMAQADATVPIYGAGYTSIPDDGWAALINDDGANQPSTARFEVLRPDNELDKSDITSEYANPGDSYDLAPRMKQLLLGLDQDLTTFQRLRANNAATSLVSETIIANTIGNTLHELRGTAATELTRLALLAHARSEYERVFKCYDVGLSGYTNAEAYVTNASGVATLNAAPLWWPFSQAQVAVAPNIPAVWCTAEDLLLYTSGSGPVGLTWQWAQFTEDQLGVEVAVVPIMRGAPLDNAVRAVAHMQYPMRATENAITYNRYVNGAWVNPLATNNGDLAAANANGHLLSNRVIVPGPTQAVLFVVLDSGNAKQVANATTVFTVGNPANLVPFPANMNLFGTAAIAAGLNVAGALSAVYDDPEYTSDVLAASFNRLAASYAQDDVVEGVLASVAGVIYRMVLKPWVSSAATLGMLHSGANAPLNATAWGQNARRDRSAFFAEFNALGVWTNKAEGAADCIARYTINDLYWAHKVALAAGYIVMTDRRPPKPVQFGDGFHARLFLTALSYAFMADKRNEELALSHFYQTSAGIVTVLGIGVSDDLPMHVAAALSRYGRVVMSLDFDRRKAQEWCDRAPVGVAASATLPMVFCPITALPWLKEENAFTPVAASNVTLPTDLIKADNTPFTQRSNGDYEMTTYSGLTPKIAAAREALFYSRPSEFVQLNGLAYCTAGGPALAGNIYIVVTPPASQNAMRLMQNALTVNPGVAATEPLSAGCYFPAAFYVQASGQAVALAVYIPVAQVNYVRSYAYGTLTYQVFNGVGLSTVGFTTGDNSTQNAYEAYFAARRAGTDRAVQKFQNQRNKPMTTQPAPEAVTVVKKD